MKTELQKMLDGELYDASAEQLTSMRANARQLLHQYNQLTAATRESKTAILQQLLGRCLNANIEPPFYCDYGKHIKGPELAARIIIGDNVWIGGGAIICPNVTIGQNTTIGAGSVVTRSIPDGVFAAGNPCRVIKTI
jgi:maltose O-acetyltransferase